MMSLYIVELDSTFFKKKLIYIYIKAKDTTGLQKRQKTQAISNKQRLAMKTKQRKLKDITNRKDKITV